MEYLLGLLLFGALMSALLPIRRFRVLALASTQWPRVRGQIIDSSVDGAPGSLLPKVEYAYSVGGATYHGSAVAFGLPPDRVALRAATRYQAGDVVWVYYDPAQPARAVLHPGGSALRKLLAEPPVVLNLLFTGVLSLVFLLLLLRDLLHGIAPS